MMSQGSISGQCSARRRFCISGILMVTTGTEHHDSKTIVHTEHANIRSGHNFLIYDTNLQVNFHTCKLFVDHSVVTAGGIALDLLTCMS